MLTNWNSHCYNGPCEFGRANDSFSIQIDEATGRGSWMCFADTAVTPEAIYVLQGLYHTGTIHVLWYDRQEFLTGSRIEPEIPFLAHPDANRLRIDLRLWNRPGFAEFAEIRLLLQGDEEEEEIEGLPLPPVAQMQAHRISGYKWGKNIFLVDHEEISVPPQPYPWAIVGHQTGRDISLQVTWPYEEPDEEE